MELFIQIFKHPVFHPKRRKHCASSNPLIGPGQKVLADARILLGILTDNWRRTIGRGIAMHNHLIRVIGLLHHNTIKAMTQKVLVIIDQATD